MIFVADVTLKGTVEVESDNIEDAKAKMEDGFSLKDFNCEDSEVDDIYPKDKQ